MERGIEREREKKKGRPVVKWGGDALQMGPSVSKLPAPVPLVLKATPHQNSLSLDITAPKVSLSLFFVEQESAYAGAIVASVRSAWNVMAKSSESGGGGKKSSSARVKTQVEWQATE